MMATVDEDLEQEKTILQLRTVAYELSIFHEELLKDRQVLIKQHEQITTKVDQLNKLVLSFEDTVDEYKQVESKIRSNLALAIAKATEKAQEGIGERLGQVAAEQINTTTQKLTKAAESATQTLNSYREDSKWASWQTHLLVLFVSVVVGFSTAVWGSYKWMVKPPTLTNAQELTLGYGQMMERVWPQLNDTQQHQFVRAFLGNSGKPKDVDVMVDEINQTSKLTNINQ